MSNEGALAGLRVLDVSTLFAGPMAAMHLGDLGADVIKVEPPSGDNLRAVGPMRNPGMGHLYLHLNRNKRSVVLDLKTPEGLAACLKLAESCDALLSHRARRQEIAMSFVCESLYLHPGLTRHSRVVVHFKHPEDGQNAEARFRIPGFREIKICPEKSYLAWERSG